MRYALNLSEDNRVLSACIVLPNGNYDGMPIVDTLPEGNLPDYQYINNEFIYNPLLKEEIDVVEKPSQLDIIEAQITYTAMMTGTLLEE